MNHFSMERVILMKMANDFQELAKADGQVIRDWIHVCNPDPLIGSKTENAPFDATSDPRTVQPVPSIPPTGDSKTIPQWGKSLADRVTRIENTMVTKEFFKGELKSLENRLTALIQQR
jgi:hypothetical protein